MYKGLYFSPTFLTVKFYFLVYNDSNLTLCKNVIISSRFFLVYKLVSLNYLKLSIILSNSILLFSSV